MGSVPLASIIINNYNYQSYLRSAIDSAISQSYSNVEVVVVDDGSTDDSRDVIAGYSDQVIPVFRENGGQASAYNAGFENATGDVVIFLDADDVLLSDTVERVMATFAENPRLAKVQYRLEIIDHDGTATGQFHPPAHLTLANGDLRKHALRFPDDLRFPPASGNAFRASVLREILPVPEHVYGRVFADIYLLSLTPLFGEVASLQSIGAYYRVHGNNNYFHKSFNLDRTRQMITRTCIGHEYITRYAEQLKLDDRPRSGAELLSVTFVANRLLSYKLERKSHPIRDDSVLDLMVLGFRAVSRRFDLAFGAKLAYSFWFAIVALGPKPLGKYLGEQFLMSRAPNPVIWQIARRLFSVP